VHPSEDHSPGAVRADWTASRDGVTAAWLPIMNVATPPEAISPHVKLHSCCYSSSSLTWLSIRASILFITPADESTICGRTRWRAATS